MASNRLLSAAAISLMALPSSAMSACLLPPIDQVTTEASLLVGAKEPDKKSFGVKMLDAAAREGSDPAKICLAWLYIEKLVPGASNDAALMLLQQPVGDQFKASSLILTGAARAQGSETAAPNIAVAKQYFVQAKQLLDEAFEKLQRADPNSPEYPDVALAIYYDYSLLRSYLEKYGIAINL